MKRMCKYLLAGGVLAGMFACQKEAVVSSSPPDVVQEEENVYMEMTLAFSSHSDSRSSTNTPDDGEYVSSDMGTEPGTESETSITEVLLVLADAANRNVAAGILEDAPSATGGISNYVIAIPFRLVKDHTGETFKVYVFCNPTDELKALAKNTPEGVLPADCVDKIYTLSQLDADPAWASGHFLMSNARSYTTTLPDTWNDYRSTSSPFPLLGNQKLEVERAVARFDYKTVRPENKYPVSVDKEHIGQTENPGIDIQLTQAAFVNVSKNFYYLRRVGEEGIANIQYCGVETKDNYVIDTDAAYKLHISDGWATKPDYFYSNVEQPDSWVWDSLSSLTDTEEDNEWGGDTEQTKGYHIWRYITENTAPSRESQLNTISTGIVFKGRIIPGTGCDQELANALNAGIEPVYVYENKLYGTWSMVEKAGQDDEDLRVAWNAVENNGVALEEVGFTEYKPVEGVYENYYYYWNVHNDNGIDDSLHPDFLGPMKYAVVRNNVYKLSVDAIFNFGFPQNEPTEELDPLTHLMVSVKVIPWVERKYEITIEE